MTNGQSAPPPAPMLVRLRIPTGAPYRALGSALAGKFAEIAGCRREDVQSLMVAFDHAAEDVVALEGGADDAVVNVECARSDGGVQVTITCGRHRAHVARSLP